VAEGLEWRKMTDICMPGFCKEKLNPAQVFMGGASNRHLIAAMIAIVNYDMKFSSDFISSMIYPSVVRIF